MEQKVRKFRNQNGFQDNTDYIEINEKNESFLVLKDGTRKRAFETSLKDCLRFVKEGNWIEF